MKKGFTLVELLAVIVIIALTSTIIFPAVGSVILQSKQDLFNSQMLDIQTASEKWATDNTDLLDKYHVNDTYITLELLRFTGYLEPDAIKNPLTREEMNGCIQIRYNKNNKKYKFVYEEKTCDSFASSSSTNNGYIIYKYSNDKKDIEKDNTNEVKSIGQYIVEKAIEENKIYTPGSTNSGLYELEDEYVFKGDVNNYIKINIANINNSFLGRILSISKADFSIKVITNSIGDNFWINGGEINFIGSAISNELVNNVATSKFISSDKVIEHDFQIGDVSSNQQLSIMALKSLLSEKKTTSVTNNELTISNNNTANQKVGTISILDYVNASTNLDCQSNFLSDNCGENNYLKTMFNSKDVWTLNKNGNSVWYITKSGLPDLESNLANTKYYIYPVYKFTSDVFIKKTNIEQNGEERYPYEVDI